MNPRMSIIIPFKELNPYVENCIKKCLELDYDNFDILLLPDKSLSQSYLKKFNKSKVKIRQIQTGAIHQAKKRNIGIFSLKSKFFASTDSDAYPDKDWLKNCIKFFKDSKVAAVGGPNYVPKNAKIFENAAIDVVYSKFGLSSAYLIKPYIFNNKVINNAKEMIELASSNLILRRSALVKIKGYNNFNLKTGEDTILCNKLIKVGYKIIYSPNIVVYHHRRPLFMKHLGAVFRQAVDKAAIIKSNFLKNNSIFFIPSIFVVFLFLGLIVSIYIPIFFIFYISIIGIYTLVIIFSSIKKSILYTLLISLGIFLTHLFYGLGFIIGIIFKKLEKKAISGSE